MDEINYIDKAKTYIEKSTNLKVDDDGRGWLKVLDSNIRIHVTASKKYPSNSNNPKYGWFSLSATIYNYFLNDKSNTYFEFILLGDIDTVFVVPCSDFIKIFDKRFMTKPHEWLFSIFNKDEKYMLEFTNWSDQYDITKYLNNLDLIKQKQEMDNAEKDRSYFDDNHEDSDSIVIANMSEKDKRKNSSMKVEPKFIQPLNRTKDQGKMPLSTGALRSNMSSNDGKAYWQMALGKKPEQWKEQLENKIIALGIHQLGNLSNRTIEDIVSEIENNYPESDDEVKVVIKNFLSLKKDDLIIANFGPTRVIGIGEVIGAYEYRPDLTLTHTFPVKWLDISETEIRPGIIMPDKTIMRINQQIYEEIISQVNVTDYLLIRHQPDFKRTKSERKYWNDLLGKEYHFGKNVVNSNKIQKGTKTIWFYTDKNKLYLWGHGDVSNLNVINNENFVAVFSNFIFYDVDRYSAIELDPSKYDKIKNLEIWNQFNAIIKIDKEIFEEISQSLSKLKIFDDERLPIPEDQIEDGYEKVSQILLIPKSKVIEILTALTSGRHVLLAGPIGTGKTRLASLIPEIFWKKFGGYTTKIYTANSDWTTQEVIGGIYPKVEDNKVVYDIQYGCVVETIAENWEYNIDGGRRIQIKIQDRSLPYRGIWLIIDEFNRADIDKAFGPLFTALRTRILKIPIQVRNTIADINSSHMDLKIPLDYRIIGTLNSADKHFLFQLSDALKSRFAYIEIDIPKRDEFETEIYYAIKNAIDEMGLKNEEYEDILIIDENNKKVLPGKTLPNFFETILQAYYYLDSIRIFKKLGTGILQLIYQNMLAGMIITGDPQSSLDNALTSTLISQLENLPVISLGVLKIFCGGNEKQTIGEYFKDACRNHNRQSYAESFGKVLDYIHLADDSNNKWGEKFSSGILANDSGFWKRMDDLFQNNKIENNLIKFHSNLEHFKLGIADLIKSGVI